MNESGFYVQRPVDSYWNTPMGALVIKASAINPQDETLANKKRTDEYVRDYLKVLEPTDFQWPTVLKSNWVECKGPSRKLTGDEYMFFYKKLEPSVSFPKGFSEVRLKWLEETGQADEIRKSISKNF